MGMIRIEMGGSFRNKTKSFSAQTHGHAAAIGEAIEYLTGELQTAIRQDHQLHDDGARPDGPFGKGGE